MSIESSYLPPRRLSPALALMLALGGLACGDDKGSGPAACTDDDGCPSGSRCDPEGGTCVAGAECFSDAECAEQNPRRICNAARQCEFREGFGDECDDERPCAFGDFCSPLLGRCLDAADYRDCARKSQCPMEQTCDLAASKCIPAQACINDDFCAEGEVCDTANGRCQNFLVECAPCAFDGSCEAPGATCQSDTAECLAAGESATCDDGEQCDALGRCVQCFRSEDCGPGLFCNVAVGRCESNVQCANDESLCPAGEDITCVVCEAPQVCNRQTKQCGAPPIRCDSDVECTEADSFCDKSLDPSICRPRTPDCIDDPIDDDGNDRPTEAHPVTIGELVTVDDLVLCPGNADWFRIQVPAGRYVSIDARFDHGDGDVELQLFLSDGETIIDESRSATSNERVEIDAGTDLELLVRVFLAVPTVNAVPYRLELREQASALCPDDAVEPDDVAGQATPLAAGVPVDGRICSADPDWFVLRDLRAGSEVRVELDFRDSLGDLDLTVFRADAQTPWASAASVDDNERIRFMVPADGHYYLRVRGKGADQNAYVLRSFVQPGMGAACQDDVLEPNASPEQATDAARLTPDLVLSVCDFDTDWYQLDIGPGDGVWAGLSFEGDGDLDLALFEATGIDGSPVRVGGRAGAREHLAHRSFEGGRYFLRVTGHRSSDRGQYALNFRNAGPWLCAADVDDLSGRGESRDQPVDLGQAPIALNDRTACFSDEDWFALQLAPGTLNRIRAHYFGADGTLDVAATTRDGIAIGSLVASPENGDVTELVIPVAHDAAPSEQQIVLRVAVGTGFGTEYELYVDSEPLFPCAEDRDEPNNELGDATPLSAGTHDLSRSLCVSSRDAFGAGDQDLFRIDVSERGQRIGAALDFERGDLLLELLNESGERACINDGAARCYSDGFGPSESVQYTASATGSYYLRVGSIYSRLVTPDPQSWDTDYQLRLRVADPEPEE